MKIINKAILIGVITFVVFSYLNLLLGNIYSFLIPGGDEFMNSYHLPIYSGISAILSVIAGSTYLINKKLNEILVMMKQKENAK